MAFCVFGNAHYNIAWADFEPTLQVDALTNYVYRGLSYSDGDPTFHLSGSVQNSDNGWFTGGRLTGVTFPSSSDTDRQTSAIVGRHKRIHRDLAYTIAMSYNNYDDDDDVDYDWWETQVGVDWGEHWAIAYHYSPNWYGLDHRSQTFEVAHSFAPSPRLRTRLSAGYVHLDGQFLNNYAYADGEVTLRLGHFDLRLGYSSTTSGANRFRVDSNGQWILGIGWSQRR